MTWSTTHLGVGTALLFIVLPRSKRKILQAHPVAFFLVSFASVLPDIDLYLPIPHRTWTHSFFIIALYLLLSVLVIPSNHHLLSNYYTFEELTFFFRVFGLLWIAHVIYDITFGPIAMFYPIDRRYFDLDIGIILYLASAVVSFGGFFVHPTVFDPNVGINLFFVNWTAEQRTQYFGTNSLEFSIMDFFLHVTMFFFYFAVVLIPAIKYWLQHSKQYTKFTSKFQFSLSRRQSLHQYLLSVLIFLLLISSIIGPLSATTYQQQYRGSHEVKVLSDEMSFYFDESYIFPVGSKYEYTFTLPASSIPYSLAWGVVNISARNAILSNFSSLRTFYDNGSITYESFVSLYHSTLVQLLPSDWQVVAVDTNYTTSVTITGAAAAISYGFLLYDWNITQYFIRQMQTSLQLTIERTSAYYRGVYIFFGIAIFLFVEIFYMLYLKKRGKFV